MEGDANRRKEIYEERRDEESAARIGGVAL